MDFGLYEMKIVRNNPSSVKSDPRLTRTNDLSPLGSDLSEVYCIYKMCRPYLSESSDRNRLNQPKIISTLQKCQDCWGGGGGWGGGWGVEKSVKSEILRSEISILSS